MHVPVPLCFNEVVKRVLFAADFFRGYDVIESSVQLGTGPDGRSNGEGLVGFASSGEVKLRTPNSTPHAPPPKPQTFPQGWAS